MAIGDIIVGVDIGTTKIATVVGEVNNFEQIETICNTSYKCNGLKKGKIINEEEISLSLSKTIKDAEDETNLKINSAYVTIPGKYVTIVQNSITKDAKDKYAGISIRDVQNAIMQVKDIEIPENKTLIDIVPDKVILDNGTIVTDPVGSLSSKFTISAQIILADKEYVRHFPEFFFYRQGRCGTRHLLFLLPAETAAQPGNRPLLHCARSSEKASRKIPQDFPTCI